MTLTAVFSFGLILGTCFGLLIAALARANDGDESQ